MRKIKILEKMKKNEKNEKNTQQVAGMLCNGKNSIAVAEISFADDNFQVAFACHNISPPSPFSSPSYTLSCLFLHLPIHPLPCLSPPSSLHVQLAFSYISRGRATCGIFFREKENHRNFFLKIVNPLPLFAVVIIVFLPDDDRSQN